ncbi:flagellar basal body P-ring protein FlgI [Ruegeria atlantica]|uniref:Flagellar basal body P-ring protein n=1 Tax=Ruegeria atlantica TaxID=81569 RepID=A0A0N7LQ16_9RHOB|nr:flagellar basal body P-ring protein FlgI [Ruegeria atlantica]CUH46764.1 flagellar basal body P-ring protein [Ruegeria atlantica]
MCSTSSKQANAALISGASRSTTAGTATLSEVVAGLNALGVSPRDMIDILKTIKAAGALHAEFIVC